MATPTPTLPSQAFTPPPKPPDRSRVADRLWASGFVAGAVLFAVFVMFGIVLEVVGTSARPPASTTTSAPRTTRYGASEQATSTATTTTTPNGQASLSALKAKLGDMAIDMDLMATSAKLNDMIGIEAACTMLSSDARKAKALLPVPHPELNRELAAGFDDVERGADLCEQSMRSNRPSLFQSALDAIEQGTVHIQKATAIARDLREPIV